MARFTKKIGHIRENRRKTYQRSVRKSCMKKKSGKRKFKYAVRRALYPSKNETRKLRILKSILKKRDKHGNYTAPKAPKKRVRWHPSVEVMEKQREKRMKRVEEDKICDELVEIMRWWSLNSMRNN